MIGRQDILDRVREWGLRAGVGDGPAGVRAGAQGRGARGAEGPDLPLAAAHLRGPLPQGGCGGDGPAGVLGHTDLSTT